MGKCQSQPNGTQPELVFSQNSNPIKSQIKPHKKYSKDAPSDKFATPIDSQDIPEPAPQVQKRNKQLGQFRYEKCGAFKQGSDLQAYKLKNGAIYIGQWMNGKTNGKGVYYLPDNSVFYGVSVQNQIQGYGRIIHQNGDYYQGQVRNSKANGQGTYVQSDITYMGNFKDNLQSGQGREFNNMYQFTGYCWQGQKQKGVLKLNNQQKYSYKGEFKHNKFNGEGILSNEVGIYQGQFVNGKKHGVGRFKWADSSFYEGEYRNDEKHGDGKLYDRKGNLIRDGMWRNNVYVD